MKKSIVVLIVLILVGLGAYFIIKSSSDTANVVNAPATSSTPSSSATSTPDQKKMPEEVIGKSVEERDIIAYHFGTGGTELLFVGGIHGGYSWNTALLAYQLVDYLKENPDAVPENLEVTIIPVLNPDGLNKVTGTEGRFTADDVTTSQSTLVAGRFNANNVDLNRNFDCDWQASGKWQNKTVGGGESAFSEPESLTLKNYIEKNKPAAVVAWYSAAGGVYASNCHNGVLAKTSALLDSYAKASGYPAHDDFDFYEVTGDMTNWLAKEKIPAISVLLTNHTSTEWTKNWKAIKAMLGQYSAQ